MQTAFSGVKAAKRRPFTAAVGIPLLAIALAATVYWSWAHERPRRDSLGCLAHLDSAIRCGGDPATLLDLLVLPAGVRGRSGTEQIEFLTKALNDEISAAGLAALKRHGAYGPLKQIFPAEAATWAQKAGVSADDCVAFKMERAGVRCEVVLVKSRILSAQPPTAPAPYRIVRVNNVKQMAESQLLAATENKP